MIQALAYLQLHTWKNHLLVRLRRLRQPKYLLGAIVGILYFYAYFFRHFFGQRPARAEAFFSPEQLVGFEMLGAFVLFLVVFMAWIIPKKRAALNFNEAEIAFLFTAPISRRVLIHYKLISAQVGVFFTALLLTAISGRFRTGEHWWMPFLAYWLLFATLGLHFLAASFVRTMLFDRGLALTRWRTIAISVTVVLCAIIAISARQAAADFSTENIRGFPE
ncbi:MAG: putative ABC exporter domain-containing protein, partial [Limisphaerales bacterium]